MSNRRFVQYVASRRAFEPSHITLAYSVGDVDGFSTPSTSGGGGLSTDNLMAAAQAASAGSQLISTIFGVATAGKQREYEQSMASKQNKLAALQLQQQQLASQQQVQSLAPILVGGVVVCVLIGAVAWTMSKRGDKSRGDER